MTLGLLDGPALAHTLGIHPGTIRQWASRGLLIRRGTGDKGRALYDVEEAQATAARHTRPDIPESATVTSQNMGTAMPAARRCSVILHSDEPGRHECRNWAVPDAPFPICGLHLRQAFLYINDRLEQLPGLSGQPEQPTPDRHRPADPNAVIYYVRKGEYIKIGTTINLRKRIREIGADELLASEPGDMRLERLRHKQFRQYQVVPHSEWHLAAPELLSHIAMLNRLTEAKGA